MVTRYCVPDREGKSPFLEGSVGGGERGRGDIQVALPMRQVPEDNRREISFRV